MFYEILLAFWKTDSTTQLNWSTKFACQLTHYKTYAIDRFRRLCKFNLVSVGFLWRVFLLCGLESLCFLFMRRRSTDPGCCAMQIAIFKESLFVNKFKTKYLNTQTNQQEWRKKFLQEKKIPLNFNVNFLFYNTNQTTTHHNCKQITWTSSSIFFLWLVLLGIERTNNRIIHHCPSYSLQTLLYIIHFMTPRSICLFTMAIQEFSSDWEDKSDRRDHQDKVYKWEEHSQSLLRRTETEQKMTSIPMKFYYQNNRQNNNVYC